MALGGLEKLENNAEGMAKWMKNSTPSASSSSSSSGVKGKRGAREGGGQPIGRDDDNKRRRPLPFFQQKSPVAAAPIGEGVVAPTRGAAGVAAGVAAAANTSEGETVVDVDDDEAGAAALVSVLEAMVATMVATGCVSDGKARAALAKSEGNLERAFDIVLNDQEEDQEVVEVGQGQNDKSNEEGRCEKSGVGGSSSLPVVGDNDNNDHNEGAEDQQRGRDYEGACLDDDVNTEPPPPSSPPSTSSTTSSFSSYSSSSSSSSSLFREVTAADVDPDVLASLPPEVNNLLPSCVSYLSSLFYKKGKKNTILPLLVSICHTLPTYSSLTIWINLAHFLDNKGGFRGSEANGARRESGEEKKKRFRRR
jgi:hypothetical protein